jgi:hypothetical protein
LKKIPAVAGHIQLVQAFQRDVTARHREPRARRPVRREAVVLESERQKRSLWNWDDVVMRVPSVFTG